MLLSRLRHELANRRRSATPINRVARGMLSRARWRLARRELATAVQTLQAAWRRAIVLARPNALKLRIHMRIQVMCALHMLA